MGCSPEGSRRASASDGLVLVQIIAGSAELVRVRVEDGATHRMTDTPKREESWPYWSSVAQRLVFQVRRAAGEADLVIWSEEHGERPLGATPGREERWPTWAPRSAKLAYAFRGGDLPAGVAIGDLTSGSQDVIARTGDADAFLRPSWAPSGDRLVAQRRLASGAGSRLWLLSPGALPKLLSDDPSWFEFKPHFTRDARHIVFSRRRVGGGTGQIARLSLDGSERVRLAGVAGANDHSARPSPSRDEIAFVSTRSGRPQIHLTDLDGETTRQLAEIAGAAFAPRWSPDGDRIAMTVAPPGTAEPRLADQTSLASSRVVVIDRAGVVLLDVPGVMPDWMPPWP
jgi:Tol biopolymer transport system component